MLVFNLRHMHTLAWKTNVVVFSIIYSRVSWWAFSLQKQMCIEQRYACYLYRKCKSKHFEGAVRLYSRAVKTLKCHIFFSCASDQICLPILILQGCIATVYFRWCNYPIILYPANMHTPAHLLLPPPPHFSFNLLHVLFYSTLHLHPPWSHLVSISPLWTPPYHNPAHGLHIPLPVAAPF